MKNLLTWSPRILAVAYILFISVFALDAIDTPGGHASKLTALLVHLIPSFILLVALGIAWRRRAIGGLLFVAVAVGFTLWWRTDLEWANFVLLTLPPVAAGVLFILSSSWFSKQR